MSPTSGCVVVVGGGIVGRTAAWQLAQLGLAVCLLDPALAAGPSQGPNASQAALGVLMARVFHRSSGRAWRLRQRSHELWGQWLPELERRGHRLPRRSGLLLLAADADERARQIRLAAERERLGIPMRLLEAAALEGWQPHLPGRPLGGLLSPQDGQIDPGPLLEALLHEARRAGATCCDEAAVALERGRRWSLTLAGGQRLDADWLVLSLGFGTEALLAGIGLALPLEPVLGQALELELAADPGWDWPGAVVWRGMNLVPRPDLGVGGRRMWLGATLEPGRLASPAALRELRELGGEAPGWLRQARLVRQWQGWRCRPAGRPAPVLEEPEPGLLLACGHYRNGVLLAPATADWLCKRIGGNETTG